MVSDAIHPETLAEARKANLFANSLMIVGILLYLALLYVPTLYGERADAAASLAGLIGLFGIFMAQHNANARLRALQRQADPSDRTPTAADATGTA